MSTVEFDSYIIVFSDLEDNNRVWISNTHSGSVSTMIWECSANFSSIIK